MTTQTLSGIAHPSPSPSSSFHFPYLSRRSFSLVGVKISLVNGATARDGRKAARAVMATQEGSIGGIAHGVRLGKKKFKPPFLRWFSAPLGGNFYCFGGSHHLFCTI